MWTRAIPFAATLLIGTPMVDRVQDPIRTIPATEAPSYLGKRVSIVGTVAGVRVNAQGDIWLDFERKSPRQAVSAVVHSAVAKGIDRPEGYVGKRMVVTGVVERIQGVLRIEITDPSQLTVAAEPNRVPCDG